MGRASVAARMVAAVLALGACAVTSAATLTLTWTPPTSYTDGTAIPSATPVTYNLYGALQGQPLQQLSTGLTATTATRTGVDPGIRCYAVTAVVAGVESAQSAQACATVSPPTPGPPNGLSVSVTVTVTLK
jgi:hypothetical protein